MSMPSEPPCAASGPRASSPRSGSSSVSPARPSSSARPTSHRFPTRISSQPSASRPRSWCRFRSRKPSCPLRSSNGTSERARHRLDDARPPRRRPTGYGQHPPRRRGAGASPSHRGRCRCGGHDAGAARRRLGHPGGAVEAVVSIGADLTTIAVRDQATPRSSGSSAGVAPT